MWRRIGMVLTVTALAVSAVGAAQFGAGVELVEVYATVLDGKGGTVTGLTASDFAVGTVTRLHESKGNSYLVDAAARVLRERPSTDRKSTRLNSSHRT